MQRITDGMGKNAHEERPIATLNGFASLAIGIALILFAIYQLVQGIVLSRPTAGGLIGGIAWFLLLFILGVLFLAALYTLQPNEAAIMQLFGSYRGTSRVAGLRGTNPFYTRKRISLRARNLNGERLKVNDKRGNPIEIAAVVVWRVDDTREGCFRRRQLRKLRQAAKRGGGAPSRLVVRLRRQRAACRRAAPSRRCSPAATSSRARW